MQVFGTGFPEALADPKLTVAPWMTLTFWCPCVHLWSRRWDDRCAPAGLVWWGNEDGTGSIHVRWALRHLSQIPSPGLHTLIMFSPGTQKALEITSVTSALYKVFTLFSGHQCWSLNLKGNHPIGSIAAIIQFWERGHNSASLTCWSTHQIFIVDLIR